VGQVGAGPGSIVRAGNGAWFHVAYTGWARGRSSAVQGAGRAKPWFSDAGAGWERDRAREMRCEHRGTGAASRRGPRAGRPGVSKLVFVTKKLTHSGHLEK
jgi:hypothetical protein